MLAVPSSLLPEPVHDQPRGERHQDRCAQDDDDPHPGLSEPVGQVLRGLCDQGIHGPPCNRAGRPASTTRETFGRLAGGRSEALRFASMSAPEAPLGPTDHRQYYETLVEASPTAIVACDPELIVMSWNPAAERLFGYRHEEAIGRHVDELVGDHESIRAEAEAISQRVFAEPIQLVTRRSRKDGSLVDVVLRSVPIVIDGELVGAFAMFEDVGELVRQRRFFESLVEMSPAAVIMVDEHVVVSLWNPGAERLFGYTRGRGDRREPGRPDRDGSRDPRGGDGLEQRGVGGRFLPTDRPAEPEGRIAGRRGDRGRPCAPRGRPDRLLHHLPRHHRTGADTPASRGPDRRADGGARPHRGAGPVPAEPGRRGLARRTPPSGGAVPAPEDHGVVRRHGGVHRSLGEPGTGGAGRGVERLPTGDDGSGPGATEGRWTTSSGTA